jgi:uncharacterized protein YlxW (UPF0749 family)
MKTLVLVMMVLLSFGKANASENSDASALKDIKKQVRILKKDIRKLETLIIKLSDKIDDDRHTESKKEDVWGCYIKDISAGTVHGTGSTEAEAKGKALEKCESKGGACWESKLKCSSDKL